MAHPTWLFEYGLRPDPFRWSGWLTGWMFGWVSRVGGVKAVLKMGIWTETKAIGHYYEILDSAEWDTETHKIIEKDLNDEVGHLHHWKAVLEEMEAV